MVKRGPRGSRKNRKMSVGRYVNLLPGKKAQSWRFKGSKYYPEFGETVAVFGRRGNKGEVRSEGSSIYLDGKKCRITKVGRKKLELICL